MARAIRETPVLYGKDAERFQKEMKRVENMTAGNPRALRERRGTFPERNEARGKHDRRRASGKPGKGAQGLREIGD